MMKALAILESCRGKWLSTSGAGGAIAFFGGLVQWMGFPTSSIEVEHAVRFQGKSTYNLSKLWKLATDIIIAFSDKPLRLAVRFGLLMSFFPYALGLTYLGFL